MRALVALGFILAELIQVAIWFSAAFYEVEFGAAVWYWSLLGLGIFIVPIGFFACFSRQLRVAAACAAALIVLAAAAVAIARAIGAPPAPGATLLEIVAPFVPGAILLVCIRGMGSQGDAHRPGSEAGSTPPDSDVAPTK